MENGTDRRHSPTLAAVARAAGVSVPTVSKVLNHRRDVATATRERVERALERMRYIPPAGHRFEPAPLVEVVFGSIEDGRCLAILHGVSAAVAPAGLATVVVPLAAGWVDGLAARRSQGAILATARPHPADLAELARLRIPCVLVDPAPGGPAAPGPEPPALPAVVVDHAAGARRAVEYLIGLGHRRIALLAEPGPGPPPLRAALAGPPTVLAGYRAAMSAAGLRAPPEYVHTGQKVDRAVRELLALERPPTALFCGTDEAALAACRALRAAGIRVPEAVSVVGCGDLPASRWLEPRLTTVRYPAAELGAEAARLLLALRRGGVPVPARTELPGALAVRDSTAPADPHGLSRNGSRLAADTFRR